MVLVLRENRERKITMPLTDRQIALILGMLERGDDNQDIAACMATNMGRISEIKNRNRPKYEHHKLASRARAIKPAEPDELLDPGPYIYENDPRVSFNHDNKFDLQLNQSWFNERGLAKMFVHGTVELVELKSESHLWERTGNICIEYKQNGQPSGIAVTMADTWVHELKRDGKTLLYLVVPMERLKELCRRAYERKDYRENVGDGKRFCVVLLKLRDLLQ